MKTKLSIQKTSLLIMFLVTTFATCVSVMAQGRKAFPDSIVPLPAAEGSSAKGFHVLALIPENKQDTLEVQLSLEAPNFAELEKKISNGEVLSEADMEKYRPKAADYDKLVGWLKEQGFKVTQTTPERTSVYAVGTIEQIERAFQVKMVQVTVNGKTYEAAATAPTLPENVGANVAGISGLQPFLRARKHSIAIEPKELDKKARDTSLPENTAKVSSAGTGLSPNIANKPPYLADEIAAAYNAANLNVTGAGQKVAILIDTFPNDSDLSEFWKRNKLPVTLSQIEKVKMCEGETPSVEGEETLDVEWSSGIAPGATIRVYATCSLNFVDIDKALDRILADLPSQPGLHQLSISLGLGEDFLPAQEVHTEAIKFAMLAARGVNVFVSSGDAGSNPDQSGQSATGPLQVEYESSDPFVVGVGGTSLRLDPNGNVRTETGWDSSGGGISKKFKRPAWQKGPGVPAGDMRLVPDVSSVADPGTGAFVFYQNDVRVYGGTSWSAPVWAGFCALLNEARGKASQPALSYLNPLLYPLIKGAAFRDITNGNNGAYKAGAGYDMVSGIGVPNITELVKALVPQSTSAAANPTATPKPTAP